MVGEYPSGTFRFKKIDGSFWNGETLRFADYIIPVSSIGPSSVSTEISSEGSAL